MALYFNAILNGKNIDVSQAMQEHFLKKAESLQKIRDDIINLSITLEKGNDKAKSLKANAVVHTSIGDVVHSTQDEDAYQLIQKIIDLLERDLRKQKEKHRPY